MDGKAAETDNRIIWFQHFHKCAGTSFSQLASANGLPFFSPNQNGNPIAHNQPIPIWTYDADDLTRFVRVAESKGVKFIATEWGVPDVKCLANIESVKLVTIMRDPWKRAASNYAYDQTMGFNDCSSIKQWYGCGPASVLHTGHNYCTRMLSRAQKHKVLGQSDIESAKAALRAFDHVFVQDNEHFLEQVCDTLRWTCPPSTPKAKKTSIKFAAKIAIRQRSIRPISAYFRSRLSEADAFKDEYQRLNSLDYQLYEAARSRAQDGS